MHQTPIDTNPKFPEHEHLKCPRCDSGNTKFCYYNNYNLSQPRHFCKNCRRYWTKGGTLRNIPIGGGSRKITKRSSNSSIHASLPVTAPPPTTPPPNPGPVPVPEPSVVHRFGNLLTEGLNFNLERKSNEDLLNGNPMGDDFRSNFFRLDDDNNRRENGWPDLSIFTPGSSFH